MPTQWSSYLPHSISYACTTTSGSSLPWASLYSLSELRIKNKTRGRQLTTCRYSTNQDISRARETFFSGKKAFLLVSERFHFYRRYVTQTYIKLWFTQRFLYLQIQDQRHPQSHFLWPSRTSSVLLWVPVFPIPRWWGGGFWCNVKGDLFQVW